MAEEKITEKTSTERNLAEENPIEKELIQQKRSQTLFYIHIIYLGNLIGDTGSDNNLPSDYKEKIKEYEEACKTFKYFSDSLCLPENEITSLLSYFVNNARSREVFENRLKQIFETYLYIEETRKKETLMGCNRRKALLNEEQIQLLIQFELEHNQFLGIYHYLGVDKLNDFDFKRFICITLRHYQPLYFYGTLHNQFNSEQQKQILEICKQTKAYKYLIIHPHLSKVEKEHYLKEMMESSSIY